MVSLPVLNESDLVMGERLGSGGFGVVHHAVWSTRGVRTEVAVKVRMRLSGRACF